MASCKTCKCPAYSQITNVPGEQTAATGPSAGVSIYLPNPSEAQKDGYIPLC